MLTLWIKSKKVFIDQGTEYVYFLKININIDHTIDNTSKFFWFFYHIDREIEKKSRVDLIRDLVVLFDKKLTFNQQFYKVYNSGTAILGSNKKRAAEFTHFIIQ